ncbi:biotin synthase [Paucibacter sp. APW11]|uniref:Biotin synthase n=1 Tax=Roseateles aquae TaxID=3077235 RepID=A0ABU3PGE3_9BURK|nr:biotin synthase [Paucibacter sp. APW11]MDT9001207.1 biotin synthase [Paucibacter sp. APW11]
MSFSPESAAPPPPAVDALAVKRQSRRLAAETAAPWLNAEVSARMAERLAYIKLQPATVLNWGAALSGSHEHLQQAYPQAVQWLVDGEPGLRQRSAHALRRPWWQKWRAGPELAVHAPGELPAGGAQLLWSNMNLHASADLPATFATWQRLLAVDGFVMFSCFGPDSLVELRALFREQGWGEPMPAWQDMHDIGDQLVAAGFADPVMDQERLKLSWADAPALLRDLRALGGNTAPQRYAALRTPAWRHRLEAALNKRLRAADGRLYLTVELVYGHAFKPVPRVPLAAQTEFSLEQMREMIRGKTAPPGGQ